MTSIYKLKKPEYQTGARLAFENFEDLLTLSEKAANIENFGAASSLCVLAIEELSKAVVLQLKAINNSIKIKDLDKYFVSHEKKQNTGVAFFFAIQSEYKDDDEDLTTIDNSNSSLIAAIAMIALILVWYYIEKNEKPKSKNKSIFNTIKESGFYVEYDESTRQWKSPKSEHNRQSFEDIFKYTNDFAETIKNWIFCSNLNTENVIRLLYTLDDNIIDKKSLEKII